MAYLKKAGLKTTLFLMTLFCVGTLYMVMYNHLGVVTHLYSTHNISDVREPGILYGDKRSQDKFTNAPPGGMVVRPKNDEVKQHNDQSLKENTPFRNIDQVLKRISEIDNDIVNIREHVRSLNATKNEKIDRTRPDQRNIVAQPISSRTDSFLTLFTTWAYNPRMFTIYNNTVNNCASFYPTVTCIVFTNDTRITSAVAPKLWKSRKVFRFKFNGIPILKYMYKDAMDVFNSEFYVYVNSDVLFSESLIKTLMMIQYVFNTDTRPILITGQRWNVQNVNPEDASPKTKLDELVSKRGVLLNTWGADYFVTTRNYPWDDIVDVIVGSLGFDNWLIMESRKRKHIMIDATNTILAVHQSLNNTDVYQSHKRGNSQFNIELINSKFGQQEFSRGRVNCIENFTSVVNDNIVLSKRALVNFCL